MAVLFWQERVQEGDFSQTGVKASAQNASVQVSQVQSANKSKRSKSLPGFPPLFERLLTISVKADVGDDLASHPLVELPDEL